MLNGKRYRDYTYISLILFFALYNINTPWQSDIGESEVTTLQPTEGDPIREFIRFIIL